MHHFIPDYFEYFAPDFTLHPDISAKQENNNTKQVKYTFSGMRVVSPLANSFFLKIVFLYNTRPGSLRSLNSFFNKIKTLTFPKLLQGSTPVLTLFRSSMQGWGLI